VSVGKNERISPGKLLVVVVVVVVVGVGGVGGD